MNLFYLDHDPKKAARMQCDKHVVKMILETAQLLSTAHAELDGESPAYKPTHKNHPSAVWVRSSAYAYTWAWRHLRELGIEYSKRYNKAHKTIVEHLSTLRVLPESINMDMTPTEPPQCMYDECRRDDTVLAYQLYYNAKADEWSAAGKPMKWHGRTAE